ncbi:amidophosphoribosyltransferase [Ceratobasidium sp. 392]|nr:amidophosphoribosyltransferase [Ceratobasidium sp. 392]
MVRDVFDAKSIETLLGGMGVGHVRYPTAGSSAHAEAQPFYVNSPYGIVFAHNGNLINTPELKHFLDADAHRHINTNSDSEVLLNIFANNLQKTGKFRINEEDIFTAIRDLMCEARGAYACVAMLAGFGIIAFRDPNGIRPIGVARRGNDWIVASESCVADAAGFTEWTDVRPGEAVILTRHSETRRVVGPDPSHTPFAPDMFEYVYLARPDSVLDGISVYRSRMAMGTALAAEVRRVLDEKKIDVDVVIPVPDTSRVAALELAQNLNIPYREGFLVAYNRTPDLIASAIGADLVIYQTLPDLVSAVRQFNPAIKEFDCSVFTGEYVTGGVSEEYLEKLEKLRNDAAKGKPVEEAVPSGESGSGAEAAGSGAGQVNGVKELKEVAIGCSGPLNGADETIGLHNSWAKPAKEGVTSFS